MDNLEKKRENSVLYKHVRESYRGKSLDTPCNGFKMSVTTTHSSALSRQLTEGVKIDQSAAPLMNDKGGFRANHVLRLRASLTNA